jgi:hypothetical protein
MTNDLRLDAILGNLPATVSTDADPLGVGLFVRFVALENKPAARHIFSLGDLLNVRRFTCCHRYEPFWMTAMAGARGGEVPPETQFLLAETNDGACFCWCRSWMARSGARCKERAKTASKSWPKRATRPWSGRRSSGCSSPWMTIRTG